MGGAHVTQVDRTSHLSAPTGMRSVLARVAIALLVLGCSDSARDGSSVSGSRQLANASVQAPTLDERIDALILQLFKTGHETSVAARWENVQRALSTDPSEAVRKLIDLVEWMRGKTNDMTPALGETAEHAIARLVLLMAAYVYEGPNAAVPDVGPNTDAALSIVAPGFAGTISAGDAAITLGPLTFQYPTFLFITKIEGIGPEACRGPLDTSLCQYREFRSFKTYPNSALNYPALVGLCLASDQTPPDITPLRLAHSKPLSSGNVQGTIIGEIEVLRLQDVTSGLRCPSPRAIGGYVLTLGDFAIVDPVTPLHVSPAFVNPPTTVPPHAPLPLTVELRDEGGRVANVDMPVTMEVLYCQATYDPTCTTPVGPGVVRGTLTQQATAGRAIFDLSFLQSGTYDLRASLTNGFSARLHLFVTAGPPSRITLVAGDNQSGAVNGRVSLEPRVMLVDTYGNRVPDHTVRFFIRSGGGQVARPTTSSDMLGEATAGAWTLGPLAGPNVLVAYADGLPTDSVKFVATANATLPFATIVAGWDFTCAVASSRPYCWGDNGFGQLGEGTFTARNRPTLVAAGIVPLTQVTAGQRFACGLGNGGAAVCWGSNLQGQIGIDAQNVIAYPTPQGVLGGHSFQQISAGVNHVCALDGDGRVWCWGGYATGALGVGVDVAGYTHPLRVVVNPDIPGFDAGTRFAQVDAGGFTTCAVTTTGDIWCWGSNTGGMLGNGSSDTQSFVPVKVAGGGRSFSEVSVGFNHVCAVTAGSVYCWGNNLQGQLGTGPGSPSFSSVPTPAVGVLGTARHVMAGQAMSCALTTGLDGTVEAYCWGENSSGQLGNLTFTSPSTPTRVYTDGPGYFTITGGASHACALRQSGEAYCWGANALGQLGLGFTSAPRATPTPVATPIVP